MMILSPSVPLSPSTHQYAVWGGTFAPLDLWTFEYQKNKLLNYHDQQIWLLRYESSTLILCKELSSSIADSAQTEYCSTFHC